MSPYHIVPGPRVIQGSCELCNVRPVPSIGTYTEGHIACKEIGEQIIALMSKIIMARGSPTSRVEHCGVDPRNGTVNYGGVHIGCLANLFLSKKFRGSFLQIIFSTAYQEQKTSCDC